MQPELSDLTMRLEALLAASALWWWLRAGQPVRS